MDNEIDKRDSEDFELIRKVRIETIKEFATRLKEYKYRSSDWSHGGHPFVVEEDDIDTCANEMMEEFR